MTALLQPDRERRSMNAVVEKIAPRTALLDGPAVIDADRDGGFFPSPLLHQLHPYLGESAGSWLQRLASSNGFASIGRVTRTCGVVSFNDNPREQAEWPARLANACGVHANVAWATLATDAVKALSNGSTRGGEWLMGPGMRHSICPECITDGGEDPGWQRLWRFATTTHCSIHERVLVDRCPDCQQCFRISVFQSTSLSRCENCSLEITAMSGGPPRASTQVTRFGGAAFTAPQRQPFPVGDVDRADWWLGVKRLIQLVSRPHVAAALLDREPPEPYCTGLLQIAKTGKVLFVREDAAQRAQMLGFVEWLLSPWPDRFLATFGRAVPDWRRHLLMSPRLPRWLYDLCMAHSRPLVQRRLRFSSRPCMAIGRSHRSSSAWPGTGIDGGAPSSNVRDLGQELRLLRQLQLPL